MPTKVIDMPKKNYPIEACVQCGELVDMGNRIFFCATMERELNDISTIPNWCPLEDA